MAEVSAALRHEHRSRYRYAVLLIGLNLLVDFGYALLDPRVKYE